MNRPARAAAAVNPVVASGPPPRRLGMGLALMFLLLLAVLALLLHGVFVPHQTLFSNDGPLGRLMSQCRQLPDRFTGCWGDLNAFGFSGGSATPGITMGLQFLLKPVLFSKLYALISLLILGTGAWCFFFQLRLAPLACLLGGLAAALNSCFFSVACWGVAAHAATAGMTFFALAALVDTTSPQRWWRVVLAGFAVGMGVIEGADVGAIYSIFVTLFIIYQAWVVVGPPDRRIPSPPPPAKPAERRSAKSQNQTPTGVPSSHPDGPVLARKLIFSLSRVALVAVCAGFIAAQSVVSLVDTSIRGVAGAQQDTDTKEARWGWATQWSLPPRELAAVVVPGLFGFRMDTPNGGSYWGESGRALAVETYLENGRIGKPPEGLVRQTGGGNYAGVLVVMLAFWAVAQLFRRRGGVFNPTQRRWLWFWLAVVVISVLLAFGRYAPFYRLLYALPYFSTIRNPTKFLYLVSFGLIVLFAYAIDGLWRQYLQPSAPKAVAAPGAVKGARGQPVKPVKPGKNWLRGSAVVLGLSLFAWLQYSSAHQALADYLSTVGFKPATAEATASFSIRQVGWFVLFFALAAGLVGVIFNGAFAGARAKWGGLLLGLLLVADLGRANLPWIVYWNYPEKYASNPVLDHMRDQPYRHRVTVEPCPMPPEIPSVARLFRAEWLPQDLPYYNLQSVDIIDMPRKPVDYQNYMQGLAADQKASGMQAYFRYWQLTSVDYILGPADTLDTLNRTAGQAEPAFRIVEQFDITTKPGETDTNRWQNMTAVSRPDGVYALFQYAGALPRAKLFANWQVNPDDPAVLKQLLSPDFDPTQTVLVAGGLPANATSAAGNKNTGTVDYVSYNPKDIVLHCDAPASAVLLLNDRIDPDWHVRVDGRPETLLRCNYLMRGVWVAPGKHTVEFQYQPKSGLLYVTLSALGAGLLVLLGVILTSRRPVNP